MANLKDYLELDNFVNLDLSDPGFASSLNQIISDIKSNFEKVVSAPYLKGDRGNSIETFVIEPLIDGVDNPIHKTLVESIIKLLNKNYGSYYKSTLPDIIYPEERTNDRPYGDAIIPDKNGSYTNSKQSIANLVSTSFTVFRDDAEGKLYLSNPYLFLDARRNELDVYWDDLEGLFIDKTCVITGTATKDEDNYIWDLQSFRVIPTLYFDEDIDQYCWAVNDELTGIIAQGINGVDGRNATLRIVDGVHNGEELVIQRVYVADDSIGAQHTWVDTDLKEHIADGDVALMLFKDSGDTQNTYTGVQFGIIRLNDLGTEISDDDYFFMKYEQSMNLLEILLSTDLRTLLDGVNRTEGTDGDVRGLYVHESHEGVTDDTKVHMIWVDGEECNIARVPYSSTYMDAAVEPQTDAKINFDYKQHRITGNSVVDEQVYSTGLEVYGKEDAKDGIRIAVDGERNLEDTASDNIRATLGVEKDNRYKTEGDFYMSLVPSLDVRYTETNEYYDETVETITYPSKCVKVSAYEANYISSGDNWSLKIAYLFENREVTNTYRGGVLIDTDIDITRSTIGIAVEDVLTGIGDTLIPENRNSYILEELQKTNSRLGYYRPGVYYDSTKPLFNDNETNSGAGEGTAFNLGNNSDECITAWTYIVNNSNKLVGVKTTTGTNRSRIYETSATKTTPKREKHQHLIIKTPWIGYSVKDSYSVYDCSHLLDAHRSDTIDIDVTFTDAKQTIKGTHNIKKGTHNIKSNTHSFEFRGMVWTGRSDTSTAEVFTKSIPLYYDTDYRYSICFNLYVIRAQVDSMDIYDVVYKLSNEVYETNIYISSAGVRSLFDKLGLKNGVLSQSNNNNVGNNPYNIELPTFHYLLKRSNTNKLELLKDWTGATQIIPFLTWNTIDATSIPNNNRMVIYNRTGALTSNGYIIRSKEVVSRSFNEYLTRLKAQFGDDDSNLTTRDPNLEYIAIEKNKITIHPSSGLYVDGHRVQTYERNRVLKSIGCSGGVDKTNFTAQVTTPINSIVQVRIGDEWKWKSLTDDYTASTKALVSSNTPVGESITFCCTPTGEIPSPDVSAGSMSVSSTRSTSVPTINIGEVDGWSREEWTEDGSTFIRLTRLENTDTTIDVTNNTSSADVVRVDLSCILNNTDDCVRIVYFDENKSVQETSDSSTIAYLYNTNKSSNGGYISISGGTWTDDAINTFNDNSTYLKMDRTSTGVTVYLSSMPVQVDSDLEVSMSTTKKSSRVWSGDVDLNISWSDYESTKSEHWEYKTGYVYSDNKVSSLSEAEELISGQDTTVECEKQSTMSSIINLYRTVDSSVDAQLIGVPKIVVYGIKDSKMKKISTGVTTSTSPVLVTIDDKDVHNQIISISIANIGSWSDLRIEITANPSVTEIVTAAELKSYIQNLQQAVLDAQSAAEIAKQAASTAEKSANIVRANMDSSTSVSDLTVG